MNEEKRERFKSDEVELRRQDIGLTFDLRTHKDDISVVDFTRRAHFQLVTAGDRSEDR